MSAQRGVIIASIRNFFMQGALVSAPCGKWLANFHSREEFWGAEKIQ
jgi:hypothetical protein